MSTASQTSRFARSAASRQARTDTEDQLRDALFGDVAQRHEQRAGTAAGERAGAGTDGGAAGGTGTGQQRRRSAKAFSKSSVDVSSLPPPSSVSSPLFSNSADGRVNNGGDRYAQRSRGAGTGGGDNSQGNDRGSSRYGESRQRGNGDSSGSALDHDGDGDSVDGRNNNYDDADADAELKQLRERATTAARDGRESSKRSLKVAKEARDIGVDVSSKLDEQGEQLTRIQNNVDDTHGYLTQSDHIIRDMRSFWRKVWPWGGNDGKSKRHAAKGGGGSGARGGDNANDDGDGNEASTVRRGVRQMQRQRQAGTLNGKKTAASDKRGDGDDDDDAADYAHGGRGGASLSKKEKKEKKEEKKEKEKKEKEGEENDDDDDDDDDGSELCGEPIPADDSSTHAAPRAARDEVLRRVRGDETTDERVERERGELFTASSSSSGGTRRWTRKSAASSSSSAAGNNDEASCRRDDAGAYRRGRDAQQQQQQQQQQQRDASPWRRYVQQQDRDLDEISDVVRDLNTLAQGINEQVRTQSTQVDDIAHDVDGARDRVQHSNRRIRRLR